MEKSHSASYAAAGVNIEAKTCSTYNDPGCCFRLGRFRWTFYTGYRRHEGANIGNGY